MRLIIWVLLASIGMVAPAFSASITASGTDGCDFHLRGAIEVGDATKLDVIPGSYDGLVLCLDSPGGSLTEGAVMFSHIWDSNIKTRVLAGESCVSACSLAFLGGSIETGTALIRFQQRRLDAGGKLGFHAPSLALPDGSSYPSKDVKKAFEIALQSAETFFAIKLTERHGVNAMTDFLYHRILGTRPESMFYIETIGDAVMANITPGHVTLPSAIDRDQVTHLCDNAWAAHMADMQPYYTTSREYFDNISEGNYGERRTILDRRGDYPIGLVTDYYSPSKFGSIGCRVDFYGKWRGEYDPDHEGEINVNFFNYQGADNIEIKRGVNSDASDPNSTTVLVPKWYVLDPREPLTQGQKAAKAAPEPKSDFRRLTGYDLYGGDLAGGVVRGVTPDQCMARCNANSACDAASYDRWNSLCFLKSVSRSQGTVYVFSKADTYVRANRLSGLRSSGVGAINLITKQGKGFRNTPQRRIAARSLETCAAQIEAGGALAFNWYSNSGQCELFNAPGEYHTTSGAVAGYLQQELPN
jgi:hypothetical protein